MDQTGLSVDTLLRRIRSNNALQLVTVTGCYLLAMVLMRLLKVGMVLRMPVQAIVLLGLVRVFMAKPGDAVEQSERSRSERRRKSMPARLQPLDSEILKEGVAEPRESAAPAQEAEPEPEAQSEQAESKARERKGSTSSGSAKTRGKKRGSAGSKGPAVY